MTSDSKAVCGDWAEQVARTAMGRHAVDVVALNEVASQLRAAEHRGYTMGHKAGDDFRSAALASTAGAGAGDWQPTDKVMEISRAKLYDIKRAWADHTALDEGDISFLLRMAGCYLREAPAVPASPRSGAGDDLEQATADQIKAGLEVFQAPPPAPAEHGVEIRELHAALSKGHALLCESGPDRCWVKIGFGWLQDAQDAHGALARFIKDGVPAALPPLTAAFSFPQPQRSRMYDVLRQLGQAAIRSQKITDHDAASAAQRECLSEIEALVSEALSQGGGAGRSERAVEIRELSAQATEGEGRVPTAPGSRADAPSPSVSASGFDPSRDSSQSSRPAGSNADEWNVWLIEQAGSETAYIAVQIAEAIDAARVRRAKA